MKPVLRLLFMLAAAAQASADVCLVNNGKAACFIVADSAVMAPQNQSHRLLRESVVDLAAYLEKISGARIPIVNNAAGLAGVPFLVGDVASTRFGKPASVLQSPYAWRLAVTAKSIGCMGGSDEAVSYAVYEILDRLGCRWYMPGDLGEVYPASKTISLKQVDTSAVPEIVARRIWYADDAFKRRNRLGGISYEMAQVLETYVPAETLALHPDWNAQINGKRSVNGRLCWANDSLVKAVADHIIGMIDTRHVSCVSLSPADGTDFCQCDKCRSLDAGVWDSSVGCVSITDRYIHFCNSVASIVLKKYPNELFGALAYVQYTLPPVRERPLPCIIPQIAPITYCRAHSMADTSCPSRRSLLRILDGWAGCTNTLAFYEYGFNLAEVTAPNPMITKWSADLPIMFSRHVKLWLPETMPNFESTLPGLWLGVRMSWRPHDSPGAILDGLYRDFYGPAAATMKTYWETMDSAWSAVPEHAGSNLGYLRRFAPLTMQTARRALDAGLAVSRTPIEYRRVKLADDSFKEFELFMKMQHDLHDGRWDNLGRDDDFWQAAWKTRAADYRDEYAFTNFGLSYFDSFLDTTYKDADRIAHACRRLGGTIVQWRFAADRDSSGVSKGFFLPGFMDSLWRSTDPTIDTWSALGLNNYFGRAWYRTTVKLPAVPTGKKVYLWLSSTDGRCTAYINGAPVNVAGGSVKETAIFSGYRRPVSFDITARVKPGAMNSIAVAATRTTLNELGSGGLLGPAAIYTEK